MAMIKNVLLALLFIGTSVFLSCESDPEPDPVIASWVLDDVEYTNAPQGFSLQEGVDNSIYGESQYRIRFFDDMTYERDIKDVQLTNGAIVDLEDEGNFEIDEEYLTLDATDGDTDIGLITEFEIISEPNDRSMTLGTSISFPAWPDDILTDVTLDTVTTQESFDELVSLYVQVITMDAEMSFDKE